MMKINYKKNLQKKLQKKLNLNIKKSLVKKEKNELIIKYEDKITNLTFTIIYQILFIFI